MISSTRGDAPQRKGNEMTLTAKEVATRFETDARTLRKFLRADAKALEAETPGKGSRYAIEAKSLRSLRKRFDAWVADRTPAPTEGEVEVTEGDED